MMTSEPTAANTAPKPPSEGAGADLDLLVLGEINPDILVVAQDPAPVFGQVERLVDSIQLTIGSSSAIFAAGAARLGLRTAFFGVVGDDALGRLTLAAMEARGIDVSACVMDATCPTGASVILAAEQDRAILTSEGCIGALDVDALPPKLLRRARHVHVGSYFLQRASLDRLPRFFRMVKEMGLTTSLDCNWDPSGRWDRILDAMLPVTDVFLPNAAEAEQLTHRSDPEEAAAELVRRGALGRVAGTRGSGRRTSVGGDAYQLHGLTVAVKCGAEGALALAGRESVRRAALPVVTVDTTGAGDSFDAGFLFAWLNGWRLSDALGLGIVCGSLSTRRIGGTEGQPSLDEARRELATLA